MDELFSTKFISDEKQFIYNFGVNRGHSLSYSKVNRCFFLSAEAKQLYHNICDYAYGARRDCFPSLSTLRDELGWSRQTMDKYLDELRASGLIRTERVGVNKPLIFYIVPLNLVPMLIHSEIVHSMKSNKEPEKFSSALSAYKRTELFQKVSEANNPLALESEILEWFVSGGVPVDQPPVNQPIEPPVTKALEGSMKVVTPNPNYKGVNIPKVVPVMPDIQTESAEGKGRRKRSVPYTEVPTEEWNTNDFIALYADLYREKFNSPYTVGKADSGAMKRIVTGKDKEMVKRMIEAFISQDFFEIKTITAFSSSFCQGILTQYLNSGKLPSYRKTEGKKEGVKQEDEWLKGLDDLWK